MCLPLRHEEAALVAIVAVSLHGSGVPLCENCIAAIHGRYQREEEGLRCALIEEIRQLSGRWSVACGWISNSCRATCIWTRCV